MWIIIASGMAVAVMVVTVARLRFDNDSDLGWVTKTWLAEHRADWVAHSK